MGAHWPQESTEAVIAPWKLHSGLAASHRDYGSHRKVWGVQEAVWVMCGVTASFECHRNSWVYRQGRKGS